jgi:hypothetical protein
MPSRSRSAVLLAAIAAICALPAGNAVASTAGFDDATGDMSQFAVDLGTTTVTVSDDAISVETAIVPRPPAGWGGCAYQIAEACIPADMSITWYLDHVPAGGSVADDGADAKVVVVPQRGRSLWESWRWDGGRFSSGLRPLGSEDPGSVRWSLRLSDLGLARPATLRIWAVSFFGSQPGLGAPIDYEDKAGPGTIFLGEPAAARADAPVAAGCKRRTAASLRARLRRLADMDVSPGRAVGATKRRCAQPNAA